jgi:hypothetical protein
MPHFSDVVSVEEYLHDVEAEFHFWLAQELEVIKSRPGKPEAPGGIHGRRWPCPPLGGARLNFDKDQTVAVAEHQVDLTPRRTEISGEESHA